jgi:hypothetical protein
MEKYKAGSMNRDDLIAAMTEDLIPVKRLRARDGAALVGAATIAAGLGCILVFGFWAGIAAGQASAFFWIANGLLLLLGCASTAALVASALPRVGARGHAPWWSAAMLAVMPLAAIITMFSVEAGHVHATGGDRVLWYWECAGYGFAAGLLVALAAVLCLRRGAPVAIERAGWLTGLAAGSLGSVAYGITCPLDTLAHVGIVHVAPVAICAVLARLAVPPLIRW